MKRQGNHRSASARALAGEKSPGLARGQRHDHRVAKEKETLVRPWARPALFAIFAASGFAGLIYESIWAHYLKLFLGHAAYAQTLVLAIFMGGMALGSWLVSHYSVRLRQLLWGYLLVEGLIGVCGILFHQVFIASTGLAYDSILPRLGGSTAAVYAFKWGLSG